MNKENRIKKGVEMEDRFDEYGRRISTAKTVKEALQEERDEMKRTEMQREHDPKGEGEVERFGDEETTG